MSRQVVYNRFVDGNIEPGYVILDLDEFELVVHCSGMNGGTDLYNKGKYWATKSVGGVDLISSGQAAEMILKATTVSPNGRDIITVYEKYFRKLRKI